MTLLLGIPLMLAEFGLGRRGQLAPIGSLRRLGGPAWARLGYVFVAAGLMILAYYSVIAGWTIRYAIEAVLHGFSAAAGEHFAAVASGGDAVAYHIGFMLLTILIVVGGVKGGIERASLILMPMLFLIVIGLAIWATTLDGAGEGYAVYLKPDLDELKSPTVWRAAAAQAFFSLSLGMGAMLTFGSYLRRDQNLPESATVVAFTDFGVAFVAGRVVGLFFFVTLAVGAFTSAISLLEVVTASVMDEFGVARRKAAIGTGVVITALGILPALSTDTLGLMDKIAGELLLVAGALATAVLAGWRVRGEVEAELIAGASPFWARQVPRILGVLRCAAPPIVAIVLFFSVRETIAAFTSYFAG